MITVCTTLKQVLKRIRNLLETGEYEKLPEFLSERTALLERLQKCSPDRSRLSETIRLMTYIAEEERFLMRLAEEKTSGLRKDMKDFQNKRRAAARYQGQSLYGVQL